MAEQSSYEKYKAESEASGGPDPMARAIIEAMERTGNALSHESLANDRIGPFSLAVPKALMGLVDLSQAPLTGGIKLGAEGIEKATGGVISAEKAEDAIDHALMAIRPRGDFLSAGRSPHALSASPTQPPPGTGHNNPPGPTPAATAAPAAPAAAPGLIRRGAQAIGGKIADTGIAESYVKTFQPELYSEKSLQADPLFAKYKSSKQSEHDSIIHQAEEEYQWWRQQSRDDAIGYMDSVETGSWRNKDPNDPLSVKAERHRKMLEQAYADEGNFGSKAGYIEDYFPHIWDKPEKARETFAGVQQIMGPTWFQKARDIDLIKIGLDRGLKLKTENPEQLITMRLISGADMRMKMELLQDLRAMDLATPVTGIDQATLNRMTRGRDAWTPLRTPNQEQWVIAPDVRHLWKNAVEARGFWQAEGLTGSAFRSWMSFKNFAVPIKLALSAFHPLHVLHINFNEGLARAARDFRSGHPGKSLESMIQTFTGPVAGFSKKSLGGQAREAWNKRPDQWTDTERHMMWTMHEGGFVPNLAEEVRIAAKRQMEIARDNSNVIKYGYHGLRRVVELSQHMLFEKWIPNLKAAAYLRDIEALHRKMPHLDEDPVQRKVAYRAVAKQIDSRFGQMFYGGVFMNRWIKDGLIASMLSFGWNYGFLREFIGAPLQGPARLMMEQNPTRRTIHQATNKGVFTSNYVLNAMAINGIMTWYLSGQAPNGLDWLLPRIGGTNPDGSPRRITNMFYTREFVMAKKHYEEEGLAGMGEMLYNKMMVQPFGELANNRSYWGYDIWDENAGFATKVAQFLKHEAGEQFNPITLSGAKRAVETGGGGRDVLLSFLGFGPAPAYAARTATQNRIEYLYGRHVASYSKPHAQEELAEIHHKVKGAFLMAKNRGDRDGMVAALAEGVKGGMSKQSLKNFNIPGDIILFKALPVQDQIALLNDSSAGEFRRYFPVAHKMLKAAPAYLKRYQHAVVPRPDGSVP